MNGHRYLDRCPHCPLWPAVAPVWVSPSARGSGVTAVYVGQCGHEWTTDWMPDPVYGDGGELGGRAA